MRLLQFTRRHITPSVVPNDAAACAMLAIELVAELVPNEAVVADLFIGASVYTLKQAYYQPLYLALHGTALQLGIVAATSASLFSVLAHLPCTRSSDSGVHFRQLVTPRMGPSEVSGTSGC